MKKSKPNILVLMSDEHPASLAGCYGHPIVRTPTIDRLAGDGLIFDSAYCGSPLCAPSRAVMMTGRHVHEIEVWDNCSPLRSDWPTFAHVFRAAGYRTALCGKMHFVGPDQLHGFEERWTPDIYPATFQWAASHRREVPVNGGGQHVRSVHRAGPGRTGDFDYDELVMRRAMAGLDEMAKSDTPFLLVVSFTGPHYPFVCPEPYWSLYQDAEIPVPSLPDGFMARESTYLRDIRRASGLEEIVSDDLCRAARRAVMGRTTLIDDYCGRLLQKLEEANRRQDTVVTYLSDHGDHLGEHGLWFKSTMLEDSARVPWIVRGPGIQSRRVAETVSLLDLGPTLAGLAEIPWLIEPCDGRDLSPLLRGSRGEERGEAMIEYYGQGVQRGVRALMRGRMKLVMRAGTEAELYDLEKDPGEWTNLIDDPEYKLLAAELRAALMKEWPDPDATDEARWQSEERCLLVVRACKNGALPQWQEDWTKLIDQP
jgi:choline-sulfatase